MTGAELRDELKKKGLKVAGTKDEMLARLVAPKQSGGV
jgi:hypothetical protein